MKTKYTHQQKIDFVAHIQSIAPDWKQKRELVLKTYFDEKELKKHNPHYKEQSWDFIVQANMPNGLNLSDWKRFLAFLKNASFPFKTKEELDIEKKMRTEMINLGGGNENLGKEFYQQYLS